MLDAFRYLLCPKHNRLMPNYRLLMLNSSHIRFAAEIDREIAIIALTYICYWMDWLILRDVLSTACNITNATYI